MRDKHQVIEEPCEFKGSSTVLKTSEFCEELAEFTLTQKSPKSLIYNLRSAPEAYRDRKASRREES